MTNFAEWLPEVSHDPESALRMKQVVQRQYKPPCWKFGCCEKTGLRTSQQRLHKVMVKALVEQVQTLCKTNSTQNLREHLLCNFFIVAIADAILSLKSKSKSLKHSFQDGTRCDEIWRHHVQSQSHLPTDSCCCVRRDQLVLHWKTILQALPFDFVQSFRQLTRI